MTSTSATRPHIAIIGGGPAGLVLLLTLHRRGIPATLYEREAGFSSRFHLGGTLDLGYLSGQRALRENGLEEAFKKHSRPEGEELRVCEKDGNVLLYHSGDEHKDPTDVRPEIDRSDLRKILLDAVPGESVQWGYALASVRPLGNGQHELALRTARPWLATSLSAPTGRIRASARWCPIYYGLTGAEISIKPEVAARPDMKDIAEVVGNGSTFVVGDSKMLAFQRNTTGRIRAYAWHTAPAAWVTPSEPSEARKALLDIYEGWAPWMRKFIENCDDEAIYHRALYYLPVGHRWDHVSGVTLVGDAAHLMGPFAGAGANLAMLDGLELGLVLAEAISEGKEAEEREAAVAAWEGKMFGDAGLVADITMENYKAVVGPDGAKAFIKKMMSMDESVRQLA
ncbi:monooxygenase FAD-binding protein [Earliella scabrosa]|nr:monooxygenase FAD-binding protein [Earliella scabrosa]